MSSGCFSWCKVPRKTINVKQSDKKPHSGPGNSVPTVLEYATVGGTEILNLLESAAALMPVPFMSEAIRVALNVLQVCKEASAVEDQVQELQDRVGSLMIVIVDRVTASQGDVDVNSITQSAKEIEKDVQSLTSTLRTIVNSLNEIKAQNRWLLVFFKNLNKSKVDNCVNLLTNALEKFNVSNDLRNSNVLQDIQLRLQKIQGLTQHVAEEVHQLHEKFDKFDQILTNLNNVNPHTASDTLARQQMPVKPRIFHGRHDFVQEVAKLLCGEATSRVCILGPGGMGKTSFALMVVHSAIIQAKFTSSHCFWVPCIEAGSVNQLLQLLHTQLRIGRDTKNALDDILVELGSSKEPRLILLDNFETPWNAAMEGARREVSNILCQLTKFDHVAILVTMRGVDPPCDDIEWQSRNLRPVDIESSRHIFHDIYPKSKDDPGVDNLLAALGYMPFAVTLMAKLGRKSRASASELLREWSQDGTGMISNSNSQEESMNRSIELSVDSKLVQQDTDALSLLQTLSLLPAGTSRANLRWWAPTLKSINSAIATLSDAALLMVDEDGVSTDSSSLFVLPVVQSFMSATNRIPDSLRSQVQEACCQYVKDHACRYHEPLFEQRSKALATEGTNIQSILLGSNPSNPLIPIDRVTEAILRFSWFCFDTKPSVEVAQRALEFARASNKNRYIAEALSVLGGTHLRRNNFEDAKGYLSEAYQLFDKLADDRSITQGPTVECVTLLARAVSYLWQSRGDIISMLRHVQTKFDGFSNDFEKACILKELGVCLFASGLSTEALDSLRKSGEMFEQKGHLSDQAECLRIMAEFLHISNKTEEALEAIEASSPIIERVNSPYVNANVQLVYGMVLVSLNRDTEALSKFEKSLLSFQYVGSLAGVAQAAENFGYIYTRRGNYQNARAAYEVAMTKYVEMGNESPMGKEGTGRCQQNLDMIKRKEQNPEEIISILWLT